MSKTGGGIEKRRSKRRPVLGTFSIFVVVPKKGVHRLEVEDLSEYGIGFEFDTEGESPTDFPIASGEVIDLRLYLNQSLYLPLSVEVARLEVHGAVRRVGAEFGDKSSKSYKAFVAFLSMLDAVADVVEIEPQPA